MVCPAESGQRGWESGQLTEETEGPILANFSISFWDLFKEHRKVLRHNHFKSFYPNKSTEVLLTTVENSKNWS